MTGHNVNRIFTKRGLSFMVKKVYVRMNVTNSFAYDYGF